MISKAVSTLVCCFLLVICLGCGQTYDIQSIEVSPPSPNVVGIGGFIQLKVTAKYTNGKTKDVTTRSSFQLAPPVGSGVVTGLTVSDSGRIQAVDGLCTWTAIGTGTSKTYATTPYILTASWEGFTSVSFISVSSLGGCDSPDTPIKTTETRPAIIYNVPEQYLPFLHPDPVQPEVK